MGVLGCIGFVPEIGFVSFLRLKFFVSIRTRAEHFRFGSVLDQNKQSNQNCFLKVFEPN